MSIIRLLAADPHVSPAFLASVCQATHDKALAHYTAEVAKIKAPDVAELLEAIRAHLASASALAAKCDRPHLIEALDISYLEAS